MSHEHASASGIRVSKSASLVAAVILVCALGYVDIATGYEINLGLFYLIPVALATWHTGFVAGLSLSIVAVTGMFTVDNFLARDTPFPSHHLIPYWNAGIRLGYFVVVAIILAALKRAHDRERRHAREDTLTGVANRHAFMDLARGEMERAGRYQHPISIAYLDCDNFKDVNDSLGHGTGDHVLRLVAATLRERLRESDVVARLGGDEFVILLPEATPAATSEAIQSIKTMLADRMKASGLPVTLSVGACTFLRPPETLEQALKLSDDLMYEAKRGGKDAVSHRVFDGLTCVDGARPRALRS
jgi:diguanylate cyclase (GGDEF)-like protein